MAPFILPPAYTSTLRRYSPTVRDRMQAIESSIGAKDGCKKYRAKSKTEEQDKSDQEVPFISRKPARRAVTDEALHHEPRGSLPGRNLFRPQILVREISCEQLLREARGPAQVFDSMPGPRQTSLSGKEGQDLIAASSAVTLRLHKHWLRPCATCAGK